MKSLFNKRFIGLILLGWCCFQVSYAQIFTDKIYVQLKDTAVLEKIRQVNQEVGWERIFPYSHRFEIKHKENGLHLWYKTDKDYETKKMREMLEIISNIPMVEQAFMPYHMEYTKDEKAVLFEPQPILRYGTKLPVNDPLYPYQWHYQNRSFQGGVDINLEKAWQLEKGCRDVIVAIMDKPYDPNHEDYKDNVWVNELELNGSENVDDDGNGYVDDIYGFDAGSEIAEHGTHVAGVIAAVNNNGIGVCGIAGGDSPSNGVRIMRCDVPLDNYAIETCAQAFVYAADHGAVISQNSYKVLSSPLVTFAVNYFMKTAGDYEGSPMKGGLVVWAAGNDNKTKICNPIDDPLINRENLIVVSSVGPDGNRACYSNYGDWVDVAAPGGEYGTPYILSTLPENKYGYLLGTSMACPHISGIAALVVSKFKGNITPKDVKHRILTAVTDVNQYVEGQGCWRLMGSGIADAWKALLDKEDKAPASVSSLWLGKTSTNFVELCWKLPVETENHMMDSCRIYFSQSAFSSSERNISSIVVPTAGYVSSDTLRYQFTNLQSDKSYYFRIQGQDRWGNKSDMSEILTVGKRSCRPVIYGEYMFNRFNLYLPSSGNVDSPKPLHLNYKVLIPTSMNPVCHIMDDGKAVKLLSFENNQMEFELNPIGNALGVYDAKIVVADSDDRTLADTLSLVYSVKRPLDKGSSITPLYDGVSLDFTVYQKKGTMVVDLNKYVADPLQLGLYFKYDKINNIEPTTFSSGVIAELKGSLLYVDYEFVDDGFSWDSYYEKLIVPFDALTQKVDSRTTYQISIGYEESMGVDSVIEGDCNSVSDAFKTKYGIPSSAKVRQVNIYELGGNLVLQQCYSFSDPALLPLQPGYYIMQIITSNETYVRKIGIGLD